MSSNSLSDLPDDILRLISFRLNGFDNCFLWMASDSNLKERLVNNVIVDFDIRYTIPGRYLWPGNFLKRLSKLSRLSLVVDAKVLHIPIQHIELHPIPTLKQLKLNFVNVYRMLQPDRSISSNKPTGTTASDNEYINLSDYYSNLEDLEITNSPAAGIFSLDFLRFLPQNLKNLSISNNSFKLGSQDPTKTLTTHIEILPRTLTSLNIWFEYPFNNKPRLDFSKLPPNLISLITNTDLDDQTYHMMPKSMESLFLFTAPRNVQKLPTVLKRLQIMITGTLDSQVYSKLEHLESLFLQSKKQIEINDLITKCPPKLKELICSNVVLTNLPVPGSLFSNCLTNLQLNGVQDISPEFISSLPQSLTHLTMTKYNHQPSFPFFSLLPRNLKSLNIDFDLADNISLLPESLRALCLMSSNPSDESYFDRFPPKLESFHVKQNLSRSVLKRLPTTLKEFYLSSPETIDDQIIQMLPRGLKQFTLDAPDNITDADAADLPPSLITLRLESNTKLTDHAISLLPRNLIHLNLPVNVNMTDECIKHMPRKLISLYLEKANGITSKSCKDLPKYMEVLSLPECKDWDPEMLIGSKNELPPFLYEISLDNQEATETWNTILKDQQSVFKPYK